MWSDPESGSQTDFASFVHFARTAERGLFDFLFLAEGLRLREHRGKIHDLDVVGRPDTLTVLNAIAAVTTHLGLGGTINTTFNEPYELARQFASLDHLSGGRAAWNLVTSSDAFTGENFRRGGFLKPRAAVRPRAADPRRGQGAVAVGAASRSRSRAAQFAFEGRFTLPPTPQGHPVLIQSGDSDEGREFGARTADAIFSRHGTVAAGQAFYQDLKGRMPRYGRRPEEITILPATTFALGDTEAEAQENAERVRDASRSARRPRSRSWSRCGAATSPPTTRTARCPTSSPIPAARSPGVACAHEKDPMAVAKGWRELAAAKGGLTIRELIIETTSRQSFVGTPKQVAAQMDDYVQQDASDGFILVPHLVPGGLDEFVRR